jgi:hypothetical protein
VYIQIRSVEPFEEAQPDDVIEVEVCEKNVYPLQIGGELSAHGADSGAASRITVESDTTSTSTHEVFPP